MTLSQAINKLFFVVLCGYPTYLECLWEDEVDKELEEVNEATRIFNQSGLDFDEVIAKKRERQANHVHEPIRFIDRVPFIPVETDDLPF
jgi:hypothetical protein